MNITLTDDNGNTHNITEAVQIIYDTLTATLDYGSGFLDYQEIAAIRHLAEAGGFEQPEYPVKFCETCHHETGSHRTVRYGNTYSNAIVKPGPCTARIDGPRFPNWNGMMTAEQRAATKCGCEALMEDGQDA